MIKNLTALFWLLFGCSAFAATDGGVIDHRLEAWIDPGTGGIRVIDLITLPHPADSFAFNLHGDLRAIVASPHAGLQHTGSQEGHVPTHSYRVVFTQPSRQVELRYEGTIRHDVDTRRTEYAGSRVSTPGLISPEGVFLGGSSAWYPYVGDARMSFSLSVHLPKGWSAVSQGIETPDGTWLEDQPQDDIYLIAAPYTRYERETPIARAQVYLRHPDTELAERYLVATEHYLGLFSRLIGPYPYEKFALVENFWESGYGMPSFTLLGSRVIRLPFILHSSYPHEILHNWWGNSVYVDYPTGNWSEGLTAYLADHLIKEMRGAGTSYRRDTLQSYADYVNGERDFPLNRFRGRHGQVSQAVGYGKTAMLFHMLRIKLGDEKFREGLSRFYEEQQFRTAGFADIQTAFESASKTELGSFFEQWTTRTGAPRLVIENPVLVADGEDYRLRFSLTQTQKSEPFDLDIPVFIQVAEEKIVRGKRVHMTERRLEIDLTLDRKPVRIMVDPRFDLFRHLDPSEIPSSLGKLFAADELTILLPSGASTPLKEAYRRIAEQWAARGESVKVLWDNEIAELPDGPLWLFGGTNLRLKEFALPMDTATTEEGSELEINGTAFPVDAFSFAVALNERGESGHPVAWMNIHAPEAAPGFARKIVHYRKYSYAVFQGERPENVAKGQWPLSDSALSIELDPEASIPHGELPTRPALADF